MNEQAATHESLTRAQDATAGSERGFGFVFASFCSIVAGYELWHGSLAFWGWIGAAVLFAGLAVLLPRALRPLNLAWFKLGIGLHHLVTPIVLALMFFAVFTPLGFLMRITKQRPLSLEFDRRADTYWIERKPSGPAADSFKNQF